MDNKVLKEHLVKAVEEAFGNRFDELKFIEGFDRVLLAFTLKDNDRVYYLAWSIMVFPKPPRMVVFLGELGTLLNHSISRGGFIASSYDSAEYHPLRNKDDTPDSEAFTPLMQLLTLEIKEYKNSKFIELFKKLPDRTQCYFNERPFEHVNFERGKMDMDFFPDTSGRTPSNIDTEPSISIIPRHGKTVVTVRFQTFQNRFEGKTEAVRIPIELGSAEAVDMLVALPESLNIINAFNVLEMTTQIVDQFKIEADVTSQLTGGLANYLGFEIARRSHRPDSEITWMDFVKYTAPVREVADWMGASGPGFEIAPLPWIALNDWQSNAGKFGNQYSDWKFEKMWKELAERMSD